MIVKQRRFRVSPGTIYGFAGGIFGVVTVGLMISSQFAPETFPACSERYAQAGMFALERSSGDVLGAAELQSKLAGNDWGVLQNVSINKDPAIQNQAAMTIKFQSGGQANFEARTASGGAGFKWQPNFLDQASAACLSYSVYLPDKFKFNTGGTLPGLYGAPKYAARDEKEIFSTRMRWLEGGRVGIQPVTVKERGGYILVLAERWLKLPRGQWVNIEQEVELNTPGQRNGRLRVWVDGRLHMNLGDLVFRDDGRHGFAGVIADTHYANSGMKWVAAPWETEIKLSPLVLRWN